MVARCFGGQSLLHIGIGYMSNKLLFKIHGWLGLNLGLILFVICFSGTFAVLSNEFDWLVNEDMHIERQDRNPDWQKMTVSLKEQFPEAVNLGMYKGTYTGNGDYFATVAYMSMPDDQTLKVYLNPKTGEVKGYTSFFNTQRFFRTFHRRFFDGNRGIFIVTLLSIPMLIIIVVGFLFYKGWLKNLFTLRLNRKKRIKWSDTHKIAGIWSLLFALLITITGLFYFYELIMLSVDKNDALIMPRPDQVAASNLADYGSTIQLKSVNTYVDSALKAYPGLDIRGIRLPQKTGDFVYINGQEGNLLTRDRANHVLLDPATSEVVHVLKSSDMSILPFITDIADPLHFGYFGGLTTKILWFVFGLIVSLSILSGTYIWVIKTVEKSQTKPDGDGFPWLRGITVSVTITLIYLIWVSWATVEGIRDYGPVPDPVIQKISENNIGNWEVEIQTAHYFDFPGKEYFEINFTEQGLPNIREISLVTHEAGRQVSTYPFQVYTKKYYLEITDDVYSQIKASENVQIKIDDFNGESYSYSLPVHPILTGFNLMKNKLSRYPDVIKRAWPEHKPAIWLYIGLFIALTVTVIFIWAYWLIRTIHIRLTGNLPVVSIPSKPQKVKA